MTTTADRRPWLIISKREATALVAVARDYIMGAPLLDDPDLVRAERVITRQLEYIEGEHEDDGPAAPSVTAALTRERRR